MEKELSELKERLTSRVTSSRLITCTADHVRVEISKTRLQTLTIVLHFQKGYPDKPLIVELRSKTLSHNFLIGLTQLCEKKLQEYLGNPQVFVILMFIRQLIDDHPLCSCSEEISLLKRDIITKTDDLKLKQKLSSISLTMNEGLYIHKVDIQIPENYPDSAVSLEVKHSNFSNLFQRFWLGQCKEIARRCIEPPLNKKKRSTEFIRQPSLKPVVSFLVQQVHRVPNQMCSICKKQCFPKDPNCVIDDEENDMHVERVYCGDLYHHHCLVTYMKSPPFNGQKKCKTCSQPIYHEKYKVSAELTETRWVYQQAREREVEDVIEFLK